MGLLFFILYGEKSMLQHRFREREILYVSGGLYTGKSLCYNTGSGKGRFYMRESLCYKTDCGGGRLYRGNKSMLQKRLRWILYEEKSVLQQRLRGREILYGGNICYNIGSGGFWRKVCVTTSIPGKGIIYKGKSVLHYRLRGSGFCTWKVYVITSVPGEGILHEESLRYNIGSGHPVVSTLTL